MKIKLLDFGRCSSSSYREHEGFRLKHNQELEWSSQSANLNPSENLRQDLKAGSHTFLKYLYVRNLFISLQSNSLCWSKITGKHMEVCGCSITRIGNTLAMQRSCSLQVVLTKHDKFEMIDNARVFHHSCWFTSWGEAHSFTLHQSSQSLKAASTSRSVCAQLGKPKLILSCHRK